MFKLRATQDSGYMDIFMIFKSKYNASQHITWSLL